MLFLHSLPGQSQQFLVSYAQFIFNYQQRRICMNRLFLSFILLFSANASAFFKNSEQELLQLKEQLRATQKKINNINQQIREKEELIFQLKEKFISRCKAMVDELKFQLQQTTSDEHIVNQKIQEFSEYIKNRIENMQESRDLKLLFNEARMTSNMNMNNFFIFILNMTIECMLLESLIDQLEEQISEALAVETKIKEFNKNK